jgi:hypothetical protein
MFLSINFYFKVEQIKEKVRYLITIDYRLDCTKNNCDKLFEIFCKQKTMNEQDDEQERKSIKKDEYYFKDDFNVDRASKMNQNDFTDDEQDVCWYIADEDVDTIQENTKSQNNNNNKSIIFTCANRSSALTNASVDSLCKTASTSSTTFTTASYTQPANKTSMTTSIHDSSSSFNNINSIGQAPAVATRFVATNKRYETFRQNKQTCTQNSKSCDEVYEIVENVHTVGITMTDLSDAHSRRSNLYQVSSSTASSSSSSTSSSSSSSRRSSYADDGYCDTKLQRQPQTEHVVLKLYGDNEEFKIDEYKSTLADEFELLNPKHKFLQYIESTNKLNNLKNYNHYFASKNSSSTNRQPEATTTAASALTSNKLSFNYIDDDCSDDKDEYVTSGTAASSMKASVEMMPLGKSLTTTTKTPTTSLYQQDPNKPRVNLQNNESLLDEVTYQLTQKLTSNQNSKKQLLSQTNAITNKTPISNNAASQINMQFNNYDVDKSLSFGLKPRYNTSSNNVCKQHSTATMYTNNTKNSSMMDVNRVRLNNEMNIDSHGSSLTNSSKQDDSSDNSEELESKNEACVHSSFISACVSLENNFCFFLNFSVTTNNRSSQ